FPPLATVVNHHSSARRRRPCSAASWPWPATPATWCWTRARGRGPRGPWPAVRRGARTPAAVRDEAVRLGKISEFGARFVGHLALTVYGGIVRTTPGSCRTTSDGCGLGSGVAPPGLSRRYSACSRVLCRNA